MRHGPSTQAISTVRFGLLLLALASLVLLPSVACHASAAQTVTVNMSDTSYLPRTITINTGDTVIWNNNGTVVQTATSNNGQAVSWHSGDVNPGQIFSYTSTEVGNFSYYCIYHPDMVGNVIVQAPVPEFPGPLAFANVGLAVLLGLAAERGLCLRRPDRTELEYGPAGDVDQSISQHEQRCQAWMTLERSFTTAGQRQGCSGTPRTGASS